MRIVLCAATAVALAACASPEPNYWYRSGATQRDFDMAMARCRMGAATIPEPRRAGAGDELRSAATSIGYMNDCLTADGWRLGPKP